MQHAPIGRRQRVNVLLEEETVTAARELGLNISQVSNRALRTAIRDERDLRWKAENTDWIEAHRRWVDENELPLEKYRLF